MTLYDICAGEQYFSCVTIFEYDKCGYSSLSLCGYYTFDISDTKLSFDNLWILTIFDSDTDGNKMN